MAELLDANPESLKDVGESFADMYLANKYLGGIGIYKKTLFKILRKFPPEYPLSLLDTGAGNTEFTALILNKCRALDLDPKITAVDINPRFLSLGKKQNHYDNRILAVTADTINLPFRDNTFDIVTSNLLLHHYYERAGEFLRELYRAAKYALVINDIRRHYIPLLFFKLASPLLFRNRITRYDGEASLRRAFTYREIRSLVTELGFNRHTIVRNWSFRFGLIIWKENIG